MRRESMWFRKASPRRQAIREDMAEAESLTTPVPRETRHIFLIASAFVLVAIALQFWPADPLPYHVGEVAPTDLRSQVAFTIEDPAQTERLREATRETTPAVLVADGTAFNHIHNQLVGLAQNVQGAHTLADVPAAVKQQFPGLTDAALHQIQSADPTSYAIAIRTLVYDALPYMPFISSQDAEAIAERRAGRVALKGSQALSENLPEASLRQVVVLGSADAEQEDTLRRLVEHELPEGLKETIASYLFRLAEPTYRYDAKLTAQLADERAAGMKPFGRKIDENQILVHRGEMITTDNYQLLIKSQAQLQTSIAKRDPWALWMAHLGRALLVLILTAAGALYVVRMTDIPSTVTRGWAVCALLLLTLATARVVVSYWPQTAYLMGFAPTLLTAIILIIAYNQRFALGMAAMHGLLVTLTLGQSLDFYLPLLAGAAVFCFALKEIRTRGRLLEIGALASAAIFFTVWALGLSRMVGSAWNPWLVATDLHVVAIQSLWGVASGVLVAMAALAILPPIERIFKITTSMTLLEWCDANKPLLRRLSQEAPGTFNHSLTVGIMAEAAGNAIGANGLLCRAGAYYHDVGKLSKPQYFIENQSSGGPNRHDKLSPAMSLLIIVGHVKDGIELAREYNVPRVIHQFIAQHHGTTLVEYFFHAAKKRKEQQGSDVSEVSESEFRYPGPKPQTREAAIVMICDACESVVRSIDEPTPGRIESAVHNITMKRLMDGQFAQCDLTLRDLSIIEETLIRTLVGVHHGRVAYPSNPPTVKLSQPA